MVQAICMYENIGVPPPSPTTHTPGRFDQFEYECKVRYIIHHIIG